MILAALPIWPVSSGKSVKSQSPEAFCGLAVSGGATGAAIGVCARSGAKRREG